MLISLPDVRHPPPVRPGDRGITVRKYIPPPPRVEKRTFQRTSKRARKIPFPDPTPDASEPIREPDPIETFEPFSDEIEILIGIPEPPSEGGFLRAGTGNVTTPIRIDETYVAPEYPEDARRARVAGNVILEAVIYRDGSVGELRVVTSTRSGLGFEEAAIAAVRRWRYLPALQDGEPVDVYFTVLVDFDLL